MDRNRKPCRSCDSYLDFLSDTEVKSLGSFVAVFYWYSLYRLSCNLIAYLEEE